jgi:hypothetical protein
VYRRPKGWIPMHRVCCHTRSGARKSAAIGVHLVRCFRHERCACWPTSGAESQHKLRVGVPKPQKVLLGLELDSISQRPPAWQMRVPHYSMQRGLCKCEIRIGALLEAATAAVICASIACLAPQAAHAGEDLSGLFTMKCAGL